MGIFRFGRAEYSTNFFAASICMFISALCCISAFASPYWTKRYLDTPRDFQNIGLWELCLYKFRQYKDDLQIPYTGCFWFWTNDMYRFRDWIIPRKRIEFLIEWIKKGFFLAWFKWVQAFATLGFIFTIGMMSTIAIGVFSSFRWQWKCHAYWCLTSFLVGRRSGNESTESPFLVRLVLFELAALCIYGASSQDRLWMPRPEFNYLSYSYWLEVGALIFALLACKCFFFFSEKWKSDRSFHWRWIICSWNSNFTRAFRWLSGSKEVAREIFTLFHLKWFPFAISLRTKFGIENLF